MKFLQLSTWAKLPLNSMAVYQENGRQIVLAKLDWILDVDHNGSTYMQGITRSIDPDQPVLYLGDALEALEDRVKFLSDCNNNDLPGEL